MPIARTIMLSVLALLPVGTAKAQVRLQLKFPPGQSYRQVQSVTIDRSATEGPVTRRTRIEQRFVMEFANGQPDPEGVTPVQATTSELRMDVQGAGQQHWTFNSTQIASPSGDPQFDGLERMVHAMAGQHVTYLVDPQRRVLGVQGVETILASAPADAVPLLKKRLVTHRMIARFQEDLDRLPQEPIQPGDRWQLPFRVDLSEGQELTLERHYVYMGPTQREGRTLQEIRTTDRRVIYTVRTPGQPGISVKQSDLEVTASEGWMHFDEALGRVIDARIETTIAGDVTLCYGRSEVPSRWDLLIASRSQPEGSEEPGPSGLSRAP